MLKILSASADWEVVDDNGFIYKRHKRVPRAEASIEMPNETGISGEASVGFHSFENYRTSVLLDFEENQEKRKEMLLSLRSLYAAELQQCEDMLLRKRQEAGHFHCESDEPASVAPMDFSAGSLGDPYREAHIELSTQVEELEHFIKECTYICDRADYGIRLLDREIREAEDQLHLPLFINPEQIFSECLSP